VRFDQVNDGFRHAGEFNENNPARDKNLSRLISSRSGKSRVNATRRNAERGSVTRSGLVHNGGLRLTEPRSIPKIPKGFQRSARRWTTQSAYAGWMKGKE
jgi:hypothetical protein